MERDPASVQVWNVLESHWPVALETEMLPEQSSCCVIFSDNKKGGINLLERRTPSVDGWSVSEANSPRFMVYLRLRIFYS